METNKMKQTYEAPDVKVVRFQVEKGFASSNPSTPLPISGDASSNQIQQYSQKSEGASGWGTFE